MKQKLQDLILRIKHEKKFQVMLAGLILCILWLAMNDGGGSRPRKPKEVAKNSLTMNNNEAKDDLLRAFKEDLDSQKTTQTEIQKQLVDLKSTMEEDRQRVADIFKKMLDRLAETQTVSASTVPGAGGSIEPAYITDGGASGVPGMPASSDGGLAQFGDMNQPIVAPPAPPAPKKIASIGPGDSVRVKLLAGVNAPTDGTPYPVVFKLNGDVNGPDGSALPLGEARLVAAAQGSLTDSRALFRLTTLNIRLPDGQKKVVNVDGWVVGEDGLRGMEGIMIDPIGKAIAAQAESGFISGLGQGFSAAQTTTNNGYWGGSTTTVTGSASSYALGQGISGAANAYSREIDKRTGLLVPHVQVFSGREATAVFSKSVNITDLYDALENGDKSFSATVD